MKGKTRAIIISIVALLVGTATVLYVNRWQPSKYAVRTEKIQEYPNSILVKEAWHTGTGWEKVGNQDGFYEDDKKYDVYLVGNTPPKAGIGGDHVNTFLCLVEYQGVEYVDKYSGEHEKYIVHDWYPIYPVRRYTILPDWLYPKGYMTESELEYY